MNNRKQKWTVLGVAGALLLPLAGITGFASDAADVRTLQKALIQKDTLAQGQDLNEDGAVNGFDLVRLRRQVLKASQSGEIRETDVAITEQTAKLVGRTLRKGDTTWLVQSGAAAEFTVTGTSAELTLAGDGCAAGDEKYRPRYAVYVDGELLCDSLMSETETKLQLFSGDTVRHATVKVIHLSEANNGAIGVKNLHVAAPDSLASPCAPTAKKSLSIEFIGDSITCAYGVEGKDQYEAFRTDTENFMKSYAYLTAQLLDADYSAVSYSGYGVVSGYTTGERNTESLVPDCYDLVGKLPDYAEAWDFDSHTNDVVVINLGTNDSSYLSQDFDGRKDEFTAAYTAFLKQVREKNPEAVIICTMGTMGGEDLYPLIQQAITDYTAETGDSQVRSYQSATQKLANGLGSDWHPSALTHELSAYVLADQICTAIGREWSKIGLDAASEGTYDVKINTEAGANAAHFVGYDKSFWINMVGGGTKPEDVQAYVGGLTLTPGTYELAFDYTSTVDVTVTYGVQQLEDPEHSCVSGSIDATGTKQHAAKAFTITEPVEDAAIVFNLGGTDYYNITLSDITLFKKA